MGADEAAKKEVEAKACEAAVAEEERNTGDDEDVVDEDEGCEKDEEELGCETDEDEDACASGGVLVPCADEASSAADAEPFSLVVAAF